VGCPNFYKPFFDRSRWVILTSAKFNHQFRVSHNFCKI